MSANSTFLGLSLQHVFMAVGFIVAGAMTYQKLNDQSQANEVTANDHEVRLRIVEPKVDRVLNAQEALTQMIKNDQEFQREYRAEINGKFDRIMDKLDDAD